MGRHVWGGRGAIWAGEWEDLIWAGMLGGGDAIWVSQWEEYGQIKVCEI